MKNNYEKGYAAGYSAALDEISEQYYQEIKKLKLTLIANEKTKTFDTDFEKTVSNALHTQSIATLEAIMWDFKGIVQKIREKENEALDRRY